MGKYWMLTVATPPGERRATIGEQPDLSASVTEPFLSWISGQPLTAVLPTPLEFQLDPASGDYVTDFFPPAIPLMSGRMVAALTEAGVNTLQLYDALIRDKSGQPLNETFMAVNILGRIACANLEASECTVSGPGEPLSVEFDSLVVDEAKAGDALFFRLHEAPNGIVIHEAVRQRLEPLGLRGVTFVKPEDWSG